MDIRNSKAFKKLDTFLKTSLNYYGMKISLNSNQHFSIQQISNPDKEQISEYRYVIQYGFPQSGGVNMHFFYSQEDNSYTIDKVSVYAPLAGENIIMANFAPQAQVGEIGISVNFGMDSGTKEHTRLTEIEAIPML